MQEQKINLDNLTFDFNRMSAQDIWDFEEETGGQDLMEFAQSFKDGKINEENFLQNLKPIIALMWIIVRQDNPTVSIDQVARHPMLPLFTSASAVVKKESPSLKPLAPTKPAKRQPKATAGARA